MKHEWQPITHAEMDAVVANQLTECSSADRALFTQLRIEPIKIRFERGTLSDEVFIVAKFESKVLYYDDTEDGFEVGAPGSDGVLRNTGCGQFSLGQALAQLRIGSR